MQRSPGGAPRLGASKTSLAATAATRCKEVLSHCPSLLGCATPHHSAEPEAQFHRLCLEPLDFQGWLASPSRAPAPLRTRGKDTSREEGGETYRVPVSPPPRRGLAETKSRGGRWGEGGSRARAGRAWTFGSSGRRA